MSHVRLTERQMLTLRMLADGYQRHEIATELFVSMNTVNTHMKAVARKLGSRNTVHMVSLAYRAGLLETALDRVSLVG